ncbi:MULTISPECIES: amidohydrolase [Streptomyces]|uniref:amidohydrolase n=2 Tax=Streptomyces TaxID=1883 RepID=UPI00342F9F03
MPQADTIVLARHIHTLDPDKPGATAVAVTDGLIAAVGDHRDVRDWRGPDTEIIDLEHCYLTPGLVDGHTHPVLGLDLATGIDLSAVATPDQLRDVLADAARSTPRGGWVTGFGLEHSAFDGIPITAAAIDNVLGDVPALLGLYDGHSALASTRALHLAGVTGPRVFPQRSTVVCDPDGRPTGHLLEAAAMALVQRIIPRPDQAQRRAGLRALLDDMAAVGLTGGHVMDCQGDALDLVASLDDEGELPLRLRLAPWCMPGVTDDELDSLIRDHGRHGRYWQLGAVKFFIDGTVEGGTAWLEHADCHGEGTESFWRDPSAYARAVHRLAAAGIQTATHAVGDAGVQHVLDTLESVRTRSVMHRIEHIESLPLEHTGRFAKLGVAASMQPTHAAYTRAEHTDEWSRRLGHERANRAWCTGDIHATGATLVLGSDWPIAHYDPREVLATARLRRLPSRPDAAPVAPGQALDALAALHGMTTNPAKVAGEQASAGRIAPGYRADLTVFGADPVHAPADELADAPIALTMLGGNVTHRA